MKEIEFVDRCRDGEVVSGWGEAGWGDKPHAPTPQREGRDQGHDNARQVSLEYGVDALKKGKLSTEECFLSFEGNEF